VDVEKCWHKTYIIPPDSKTKILWDLVTNIFLTYSYVSIPYNIALNLPEEGDSDARAIEFILDFLIILDIMVSFFSVGGTVEPGVTLSNKYIARQYIGSYLFFDLLGSVPGLFTLETNRGRNLIYSLKLARYSQVPRTFDQIEGFSRILMNLGGFQKHTVKNIVGYFR